MADFNLSQAVLQILQESPNLSGKEMLVRLGKEHSKETINEKSALVAFSTARKKLGLTRRGTTAQKPTTRTRKARKAPRKVTRKEAHVFSGMDTLKLAKDFVLQVGGVDGAQEALKTLEALQVKG